MTDSNLKSEVSPVKKFQFIGGDLSLDFTNSMGGKREGIPHENFHSYNDFLSWCLQAGLLNEKTVAALAAKATLNPQQAAVVLKRAIELREGIYRIFAAVIEDRPPTAEEVQLLNRELAAGLGRLYVGADDSKAGFKWDWAKDDSALDQALGPVARAAAELLTTKSRLSHVERCAGDNCGWLFIDSSKNHSRRWCDMRDCGNRAKVRRHRMKNVRA